MGVALEDFGSELILGHILPVPVEPDPQADMFRKLHSVVSTHCGNIPFRVVAEFPQTTVIAI